VVDQHGLIVSWGQLPHHFSVFTAEAVAIIKAIKFAIELKGSYIICSDSLSTLQGVQNFCNNNNLLSEIRHLCIKNNSKIKLLWVPAHIGIIGNELADNAAKLAGRAPCHTIIPGVQQDIWENIKHILLDIELEDWSSFNHWYKQFNPDKKDIKFPTSINGRECAILTRLKTGHTNLTHKHILNGESRLNCPNCGEELSVKHLLDTCGHYQNIRTNLFGLTPPSNLLTDLTAANSKLLLSFLRLCKIIHLI